MIYYFKQVGDTQSVLTHGNALSSCVILFITDIDRNVIRSIDDKYG